MTRRLALSLLALLACACQAHLRAPAGLRPLDGEAEVWVYLRPLPPEAERLSFELAGVAALAADGTEIPLQLRAATVARGHGVGERLLAWGRLPPGRYDGFAVRVARASLTGEDGRAELLVPADPVEAPVGFAADRGGATVVALTLRYPPSLEQSFRFEP